MAQDIGEFIKGEFSGEYRQKKKEAEYEAQYVRPMPRRPVPAKLVTRQVAKPRQYASRASSDENRPSSGVKPPARGYSRPFDYRLWNKLLKEGKVRREWRRTRA